ncbi:TPA: DNA-binding transcriptional regulator [Raoultella planticola]|nr:DNA-binding transcriptional regulator [Raoultella planticola]
MEKNTPSSESPAPQEPPHDRQVLRILRNVDLNLLTIFEAVYVHKGIVNAAKVLNITPSAISQSLNKLRALFPDPLFIRKGQGVRPTAYASHLHQYISQGMESFLCALELASEAAQPRAITIATSPLIGALVIPTIAHALKPLFPQLRLHNIAITDASSQLNQRQVDLLIDSDAFNSQTIAHHVLFEERLVMYCREGHPALQRPLTEENLRPYEFALKLAKGQRYPAIYRQLQEHQGERRCGFSSDNLFAQAALISQSDMLGLVPERMFSLLARTWSLARLDDAQLPEERIEITLHYNRLSAQEPLLNQVIEVVCQSFKQ